MTRKVRPERSVVRDVQFFEKNVLAWEVLGFAEGSVEVSLRKPEGALGCEAGMTK